MVNGMVNMDIQDIDGLLMVILVIMYIATININIHMIHIIVNMKIIFCTFLEKKKIQTIIIKQNLK